MAALDRSREAEEEMADGSALNGAEAELNSSALGVAPVALAVAAEVG